MKGYQENGRSIPFATNIGGAFEHAAAHNNQAPYNLPESWMKSKSKSGSENPAELRFHGRHYRRKLRIADRK